MALVSIICVSPAYGFSVMSGDWQCLSSGSSYKSGHHIPVLCLLHTWQETEIRSNALQLST
jgi:hypothetical protein